jgi:hypothetical protein
MARSLGEWNLIGKLQRRAGVFRDKDAAFLDFCLGNSVAQRLALRARAIQRRAKRRPNDRKRFSDIRQVGIKDFALTFRDYGVRDYLAQRPAIKVIGLERQNLLDRMISNALLEASGVVEIREGEGRRKDTSLRMEPQKILDELEVIEAENIFLRQMFEELPEDRKMHIYYEDFFAGPERTAATMTELHSFLDVDPFQPEVRMRKIVQGRSIDRLANKDDVIATLSGTRFERYLNA